jgi:serine/threonine protein kinase
VAIKVLRKRLRGRSELVERFLREAEIVSRFSHPGIVPILGLGRLPDHNFFIVMELIDGPDLAKACQNTPLTPRRAAEIVGAVAGAIEHANQRGVIHRDLKPGNVLVDRNGRVFVTDFGFAWFDSELDRDVGSIVGTAGFMAPEQIDPSLAPIGPPTDVYGLGALLRMLVCGPRSASDDSTGEFADLASRDARGRTDDVGHDVPRALIDIWARCLEPNWQRRFRGAGEVGAALQDWLDGEKAPASAPPQSAETNRQAQ